MAGCIQYQALSNCRLDRYPKTILITFDETLVSRYSTRGFQLLLSFSTTFIEFKIRSGMTLVSILLPLSIVSGLSVTSLMVIAGTPEDAGLFLHRAAIRKHAARTFFQRDEVEKAERLQQADIFINHFHAEFRFPVFCPGVQAADNRQLVLLVNPIQATSRSFSLSLWSTFSARCMVTRKYLPGFQTKFG